MQSELLKLKVYDFVKGAVVATLAAVFAFLAQSFNVPGFDFQTFEWSQVLTVASGAFIGYITKNFLTDSQGKILGKV